MNPIAVIIDKTQISWESILIVLAILAWFFRFHSIYAANRGKRIAAWLFLPIAVFFCAVTSRLVFWYTHIEQYESFKAVLTDMHVGCFSMLGILPGIFLTAALLRLLRLHRNLPAFLDALAPATALGMGLLYLTCLFNSHCRSKFSVTVPSLQHLPFASPVAGADGPDYRFATFFFSFLFLFLLSHICTQYYYAHRKEKGATACLFLMLFCAGEFLLDSTRYDAEYFPFNGFVSILQIFAGVCFLVMGICFSVRAIRRRGMHWYFVPLWLLLLGSMTATGILEYLVQRYADKHQLVYCFMALSCLGMFFFCYILFALGRKQPQKAKNIAAEEYAALTDDPDGSDAAAFSDETDGDDAAAFSDETNGDDAAFSDETNDSDAAAFTDDSDEANALPDDSANGRKSSRRKKKTTRDDRPAMLAFLSALMAAIGLGALFASRKDK